ncbi:phycobilisome rod-core linker polypeptide [Prochlorococcus sp. MIT 1307]|uniref:phycobilisome rod-core linker polypeptide n=1 Tax=Prochlorococcus sp. MIT 1307 TaxID=3096219 RepID=UPI002A74F0A8|nr:phycobilisome rod-core linker polypeptide [Prochlorococcus sp. MIT 1307]
MSSIPVDALAFGGQSLTEQPITYDKTRISGSTQVSYILHSKGGCMPGQQELFMTNSRTSPGIGDKVSDNKVMRAFRRERYLEGQVPMRTKFPKTARDSFTYDEYVPNDDESLNLAIKSSYRQVFGNFHLMESERPIELERRLRNGDLVIREFIRLLSKSEFYKAHYLENVSQQRCIELNFKHLLGRPPLHQQEVIESIEVMSEEGFDSHVDKLIDSIEYQEAFGPFIVPYQRCWNSPSGARTSSFINTYYLTQSFATSDNALHKRKTLSSEKSGVSQLVHSLTNKSPYEIIFPKHAEYLSTKKKESDTVLINESFPS